ncbi:DNA mismatch repair endonuclease MutL [Thalassotalea aquiviva]|uniref:DNA mismatch repair endonuclease MutL n=1 Tax=Thalassotalea aquiviva TaxID=3242415 RepID=UPI00352AF8F0
MSIQILPARLANQIAAGEVVERPASVVKELVENSIDAGATSITIEIDKGGAKRIKVTDDGCGIAKDQLTLALSRHATSKIKSLDDLEAIQSLGFRGEALASISSVARLTLTSKTEEQESAWQAIALGREMQVEVKPAAHPKGTSINVEDLFFNTPARRKFLRTEKTEFSHIDEVVRRIALSKLDLSLTLTHNGKVIRQYRAANNQKQIEKRIAAICGQAFMDNAIALEFDHDNFHLWGWIAQPEFIRSQNDLSYSYVNGRMMRDKLINHAIRQAYGDRLGSDGYPAFVLFFNLDHKDVDVNVHPAKHEVRFHQSRLVHDFICAAIEQTLEQSPETHLSGAHQSSESYNAYQQTSALAHADSNRDYVQPLKTSPAPHPSSRSGARVNSARAHYASSTPSKASVENYQQLITPVGNHEPLIEPQTPALMKEEANKTGALASDSFRLDQLQLFTMLEQNCALASFEQKLICLDLTPICKQILVNQMQLALTQGIVSQPLLLPVRVALTLEQQQFIGNHQHIFVDAGVILELKSAACIIRQYPAKLREQDIQQSFIALLDILQQQIEQNKVDLSNAFACMLLPENIDFIFAKQMLVNAQALQNVDLYQLIPLNSVEVDLTKHINQLKKHLHELSQ